METQMAGSISRLDGNMSQDAVFKDILAYFCWPIEECC